MKEDKVIELGYEFGIDSGDECFEFGKTDLQALINHVEQATLERAAVIAERTSRFEAGAAGMDVQDLIARTLRKLKDSND